MIWKWQAFNRSPAWIWFWKAMVLILFSLGANHLTDRDSFPWGESYEFPLVGFMSSILLSVLIGIIAHLNFRFFKKKFFTIKVELKTIVWFMVSTLGYIILMYIPVNILLNIVAGGANQLYYLLIGLLITLLLSFVFIGLWYAQDLYHLYQASLHEGELTIERGIKIIKLSYNDIAYFYSENKIVHTVQNDGTTLITDFTLNELEEKTNDQMFFRVNRQVIIHKKVVDQIEKIENGKLHVRLKTSTGQGKLTKITISRYKRKAFMDWVG
jgi:hypothetical protein